MGSSNLSSRQIFDSFRGIWVKATPEEIVRQSVLRKMVHDLGYPRELIAVEKEIGELVPLSTTSAPQRRIDIVCFKKNLSSGLQPLILIECKDEPFTQKAIDQVIGYNAFIKAPFLSVVSREGEVIGHWDELQQSYRFRRGFPGYQELLECVTLAKS
ncbi:MAG: type I restriction enzyme HsdR N-terminal domain-containing protein [Verrucomicrobia bacterium]|nr:type I restriction enzyme HsdR N-terminal domain-containing protein [Verrucomicrobiota bacterium]